MDSKRREVESNCVHNNIYYVSDSIRTKEQKTRSYYNYNLQFCKSPTKITLAKKYAGKVFITSFFEGFFRPLGQQRKFVEYFCVVYLFESKEFFRIVVVVVMLIDRSSRISSLQNVPVCRHYHIILIHIPL